MKSLIVLSVLLVASQAPKAVLADECMERAFAALRPTIGAELAELAKSVLAGRPDLATMTPADLFEDDTAKLSAALGRELSDDEMSALGHQCHAATIEGYRMALGIQCSENQEALREIEEDDLLDYIEEIGLKYVAHLDKDVNAAMRTCQLYNKDHFAAHQHQLDDDLTIQELE